MINEKDPLLFHVYPELKKTVSYLPLGKFPTPVKRLESLGKDNLWIKRDDLNSDLYSGNKVRKLEFILADVLKKGKKRIVTMGGIGTNHGLATGIYGCSLGLDCKLLTFHQPVTRFVKKNMLLFCKYAPDIEYCESVWKTVLSYFIFERFRNPGAYFLYAGGSSPLGTVGFVNAAFELKRQIEAGEVPEPDYIFAPLGSNGTVAGLALGCQLAGLKTKLIGVTVTFSHLGPFPTCTQKTVLSLMKKTYRFLKKRCSSLPVISQWLPPLVVGDYVGDGYGCPTEECCKMITMAREKQGITLDPTYTAKAFCAFLDYSEKSGYNGKSLLYWHTFNSVDLSRDVESLNCQNLPDCLRQLYEEQDVPV